jgi:hypothetical protein
MQRQNGCAMPPLAVRSRTFRPGALLNVFIRVYPRLSLRKALDSPSRPEPGNPQSAIRNPQFACG